jgi:hypothetical protein
MSDQKCGNASVKNLRGDLRRRGTEFTESSGVAPAESGGTM